MESAIRGLVLDSSVLVAAERAKLTTPEVLRNIRASADVGDAPIVISAMTVVTQPTEAGPPRQIAPGLNHTLSLAE